MCRDQVLLKSRGGGRVRRICLKEIWGKKSEQSGHLSTRLGSKSRVQMKKKDQNYKLGGG